MIIHLERGQSLITHHALSVPEPCRALWFKVLRGFMEPRLPTIPGASNEDLQTILDVINATEEALK